MNKIGLCFSGSFTGSKPLSHLEAKLPVYLRLLDLCLQEDWEVYVLTSKTYRGDGIFEGAWRYQNGKLKKIISEVKIDLVYDRSGGIKFPIRGDSLRVVNCRDFKILAWDKFKTYQEIGKFMPKTVWLKDIDRIKTAWVVAKPFNGLKGIGIYVGPRKTLTKEKLLAGKKYVVQEFVDTSKGLPGIASGMHDLRIVVVNAKPVWCHVRVPAEGKMLANRAQGGTLTEIDYTSVPDAVKKITEIISARFYAKYDNPIFSLDFGMDKAVTPKIFEINDQIGFPQWEMKNRDVFLKSLVDNFRMKLNL